MTRAFSANHSVTVPTMLASVSDKSSLVANMKPPYFSTFQGRRKNFGPAIFGILPPSEMELKPAPGAALL